ncbi:MAG: DUF1150 domain-containing protein [Hyphomicrobiales bacterium]|nr:DUF1150 domain-containing protein [Hyphomicrobiales bacterium]
MTEQERKIPPLSADEFAHLGGGEVAYIREIEAQDAIGQFPSARRLPATARLFVLHAADGTPILLGDNRDTVIANAREHSLMPVSVH